MEGPTGEMETYTLQILSNRLLQYERTDGPDHVGHVLLTEILAVHLVGTVIELITKYRRLRIEPPRAELALWHLRLQEMPTTKHVALCEGWLYKVHLLFSSYCTVLLLLYCSPTTALLTVLLLLYCSPTTALLTVLLLLYT